MKTFSTSFRRVWQRSTRDQVWQLALALGVVMFAAGCSQKETPAPVVTATNPATNMPETAQPTTQPVVAPAIVPPSPQPVITNLAASAGADGDLTALQQLNRAVIGFRMQHHRNPSSVEEITAATGIRLPPPPAGKIYAFNGRGLVALVDSPAK